MEFTLLGNALIGAAALWGSIRYLDRDGRLTAAAPRPWDVALGASMLGLVVGRLWAMIGAGTNPLTHLFDVLLIRGGVDTVGASLAFGAALAWGYRDRLAVATDAIAAPALFGLAGWHGGCLVRGACAGTPTTLPWGVEGTGGVFRHPIEVYAALLLVGGGLLIARAWRTGSLPGRLGSLAVVVAAGSRALTEPLRLHLGSGLLGFYLVGTLAGIVMFAIAGRKGHRPRPQQPAEQA